MDFTELVSFLGEVRGPSTHRSDLDCLTNGHGCLLCDLDCLISGLDCLIRAIFALDSGVRGKAVARRDNGLHRVGLVPGGGARLIHTSRIWRM